MRHLLALAALLMPIGAATARADSVCGMTALRDVAALDNPRSIMAKGTKENAVSQYRVDNRTGDTSLCSHGGYCYPTHVMVGGQIAEAVRMTNCRPNMATGTREGDETVYEVEVMRAQTAPATLRRADVENKFRQMGLCSSCADNVAQYYVAQPQSRCAVVARRALEGDPVATKALLADPDYCAWHYK